LHPAHAISATMATAGHANPENLPIQAMAERD
jgi:hypothetical protein